MINSGFNQADFILISSDVYIDHPSFNISFISRILENFGYKVAVISQPLKKEDYLFCSIP